VNRRNTRRNPFHPSRGPLAAILPRFLRRLQLPGPLSPVHLLMPGEHLIRPDPAKTVVQTNVVGMLCVTLYQIPRIFKPARHPRRMHLKGGLQGLYLQTLS
jgi:hypothetical protein